MNVFICSTQEKEEEKKLGDVEVIIFLVLFVVCFVLFLYFFACKEEEPAYGVKYFHNGESGTLTKDQMQPIPEWVKVFPEQKVGSSSQ